EPDAAAEEAVARLLPQALGRVEEVSALLRERVELEAEAAIEIEIRGRAEPLGLAVDDLGRAQVQRVQVLLGQLVARPLQALAAPAVGLVHDGGPQVPVRDLLAVDVRLQRGLELGDALGLVAYEVAEIA